MKLKLLTMHFHCLGQGLAAKQNFEGIMKSMGRGALTGFVTGTAVGMISGAFQVHKENVDLRKRIQDDPKLRAVWEKAGKPKVKYYRGANLNKHGLIKQKFIGPGFVQHSTNGGLTTFSGDLLNTPSNELNPLSRIAPGADNIDNISHELGHAYLLNLGRSGEEFKRNFNDFLLINRTDGWNKSWIDAYNKTVDYEEDWIMDNWFW